MKPWHTPTMTGLSREQVAQLIIQASENEIKIGGLEETIRDLEARVTDWEQIATLYRDRMKAEQAEVARLQAENAELRRIAPYQRTWD